MYWKPYLAAKARIPHARDMWMIVTTPKTSVSTASTGRNLSSITATILIRSRYHV